VPHGPAITLILTTALTKQHKIEHEISVDFAVSIDTKLSVSIYDWPRPDTLKALSTEQIQYVREAGIHLVPKKELFWYISFSKAAGALLKHLDKVNECRLKCHKILKRDFKTWQSKSPSGMEGISTYVFKVIVIISFRIAMILL